MNKLLCDKEINTFKWKSFFA